MTVAGEIMTSRAAVPPLDLAPPKPWRRLVPLWLRSLVWIDSAQSYDAFLSYSWKSDSKVAPVIQSLIQRFLCPWYKLRAKTLFRDLSCLPAGSSLETELFDRLDRSTHLIVLASPEAAVSQGMEIEARHWFSGPPRKGEVLIIVSSGDCKTWEEIRDHLLPPTVRDNLTSPPVWASLQHRRDRILTNPNNHRLREELVEDLKQVLLRFYPTRDWGQLRGEERSQRRRALGLLSATALVFLVLAVAAVRFALEAVQQKEYALARQLAAQAELLRTQHSEFLERSTLLSIQAIQRLHSVETDQALRANLEILPRQLVLLKHSQPVTLLGLSHDRKYLAAASTDKVVRVWEFPPGRNVASLTHPALVVQIAFSPAGDLLATGTEEGEAVVWNLPSGKKWRSLDLKGQIDALEFSPDGGNMVVAGPDIGLRLWRLGPEPAEKVLASGKVIAATFRSDSRFVAAAGLEDDHIRIWDTQKLALALDLPQTDAPHDLAFSPDGRYLAVASGFANEKDSNAIWLWDVQQVQRVARIQQAGYIRAIRFSPDGSLFATAAEDGFARIWRTTSGEAVGAVTHGAPYAIRSIAWSADGRRLATSSTDYTARVWDLQSGREIARMTHGDTVNAVMFSSDPPYLITASGGPFPAWLDRSVRIWELPPGTEHVRLDQPAGADSIAFSPDGHMVATSSDDGFVRLFEVPSGEELASFDHGSSVTAIAFGPRGQWLAASSEGQIFPEPREDLVWLWDVSRRKELLRIPHTDLVRSIAISPDGRYLATAGGGGIAPKTQDRSVHLWEMPGGRPLRYFPAVSDVLHVGFSSDGKLGASIERSGILTVWRPDSGAEVARRDLSVEAQGFVFAHTGSRLAVATLDSARIYDVPSLREVQRIPHESFVNAVAFSPDDRFLATGDSRMMAHVWDLSANLEVARFRLDESVSSVAFNPDGRFLATAGFGKAAHLWIWRRKDLVAEACTRLTRDLTDKEWREYLVGEPQRPTCMHAP
jgi:WD40 repeat protein